MLAIAAKIPDPAARDQFADRIAHKARITEDVVRAEIRRAAVNRQTSVSELEGARGIRLTGDVRPAEKGLIWALLHDPRAAQESMAALEPADFEGLASQPVLRAAWDMLEWPSETVTESLLASAPGRCGVSVSNASARGCSVKSTGSRTWGPRTRVKSTRSGRGKRTSCSGSRRWTASR
jgi:hypothetical protein